MEFVWGLDKRGPKKAAKVHIAVPKGRSFTYLDCAISYCSAWDHVKFFYCSGHDRTQLDKLVEWEGGYRRNMPHAERRKLYEAQYELMKP